MAEWIEFPFDRGVVNSRPASQLEFGELIEAQGCVYKRGSQQLHPKPVWTEFPNQLIANAANGRTYPNDVQLKLSNNGPVILSFEGKKDWLMSVVDELDATGLATFRGASIWFAPADGSGDWEKSDYILRDNEAKRYENNIVENVKYQVAHWGDTYVLCCNYGLAIIDPPSGTGKPEVRRLGAYYPQTKGMLLINDTTYSSGSGIGPPSMSMTGVTPSFLTAAINSDLVENDLFSVFITEYNTETGEESLPIWIGGGPLKTVYGFVIVQPWNQVSASDAGKGLEITMPDGFFNNNDAGTMKFRVYFKYWGNAANADDVLGYDLMRYVQDYTAGVPGLALLEGFVNSGAGYAANSRGPEIVEFEAGTSYYFTNIQKTQAVYPLATVPIDNARLLFWRYRRPHCSAVGAIFNDSLCVADYGTSRLGRVEDDAIDATSSSYTNIYDPGISDPVVEWFEQADPSPSKMGYSMPGEFESHPDGFFINFSTSQDDAVRAFHVIGNRLIAVCEDSVHVVNYLPFSGLVQNQQGRVKSTIIEGKGTVGFNATAKISTVQGEFVVWASKDGLNWTNGTGWEDACPDFRMPDQTDLVLSYTRLAVDAENDRLHLFVAGNEYTFHYSPDHLKNGKMKMTGPHPYKAVVTGAVFKNGVGYRMRGTVLEWTSDESTNEAVVHSGHITGGAPNKDVEISMMGLTKSALADGQNYRVRADGQVRGYGFVQGDEAAVVSSTVEDTNYGTSKTRGQAVQGRWAVDAGTVQWSMGPGWLRGNIGEV